MCRFFTRIRSASDAVFYQEADACQTQPLNSTCALGGVTGSIGGLTLIAYPLIDTYFSDDTNSGTKANYALLLGVAAILLGALLCTIALFIGKVGLFAYRATMEEDIEQAAPVHRRPARPVR